MKSLHGEFMRKLGCLRIEIMHLNESLRKNDFRDLEERSRTIQDLLLDLVKMQRKLPQADQKIVRPRFTPLREEALSTLELARRILDDSLEAMMILVKTVQESSGYGIGGSGTNMLVDRKA